MESSTAQFVARQIAYGRLPTIIGLEEKHREVIGVQPPMPIGHCHITWFSFLLKKTMLPH